MNHKLTILLKKYPLFLFLLPVFFVLHGFTENYDFVSVKDAIGLTGIYLLCSLILLSGFFLLYKNWSKAAIMAFLAMALHFFFGSIYDGLQRISHNGFFTKYSVILPVLLVLLLFTIIHLKRRKHLPLKVSVYLNVLFLLLILIDTIVVITKHIALNKEKNRVAIPGFVPRHLQVNPDIYLIMLDEYAGLKQLNEQLQFDNSPFENELKQKKFHVISNSSSNYSSTPLSVASFLTMNYLDFKGINQEQDRVLFSYHKIRQSQVLQYLALQGYDLYNFSIFDFPGQKALTQATFLPTGKKLITSQTFLSRLKVNLGYHLYSTFGVKQNPEKDIFVDLENNTALYKRTFGLASLQTIKPKFVYTHLMMPHYPYYFTKEGKQRPVEELLVSNKTNQAYYLEYLTWCNNKILALVTEIQNNSPGAIIVIAGDHGFRAFDREVDQRYLFYNLCGVYLPSHNYSKFYHGLSSVNLFRTILNTEFQQRLPMLKDSCMFEQ